MSIKLGALVCFASVILGAALIAARTHYSENENGFYKASDGNYYAYSRQGSNQLPEEEEPSFFGWIIQGIKRMLGIVPVTDPRQGQSFLGSLLSSGGWILPATGVAVAGVYREEISDIIEEIVDPSTAKPNETTTAKPDPCTGVTCSSGLVAVSSLGICQCLECGADSDCTGSTNGKKCVNGQCPCGSNSKCSGTTPFCGSAATTEATAADSSPSCYCSTSSCTESTHNKCTSGACVCGTTGAACSGGTPHCVDSTGSGTSALKGKLSTLEDTAGTPKCSCYAETTTYTCESGATTDCVIKSCSTSGEICCGDGAASAKEFTCEMGTSSSATNCGT